MSVVVQWFLQNLGAVLAGCAAICLALAGTLIVSIYRRRPPARHHDMASREIFEKRQKLKLYCGDIKVLANLALQRHMDDVTLLSHLRSQPSFRELMPYFSPDLQERLTTETSGEPGKSLLALACLNEIERLELNLHEGNSSYFE